MSSKVVSGFKVIPIRFSATSSAQHELYIREHSIRKKSDNKPIDRTLFVLNVPPYVTEDSFKRVFSCVGPVKSVIFEDKSNTKENESNIMRGFKVAFIIYEKSPSVEKALNLTSLEPLSTEEHPVKTGVQYWVEQYNKSICDRDEIEEDVKKFMTKYDKEEKRQKQQEKEKNDGGWTVVGRKGRNPGVSRKESVENKLLEKTNKGVKRKQLDDFYVFQKRESKQKHLAEMRRQYEEDKKKVDAMKQARKFKPF